jgi:hypothetical protein
MLHPFSVTRLPAPQLDDFSELTCISRIKVLLEQCQPANAAHAIACIEMVRAAVQRYDDALDHALELSHMVYAQAMHERNREQAAQVLDAISGYVEGV